MAAQEPAGQKECLPSVKTQVRRRSSLGRGRRSSVNFSQANVEFADILRDISVDLPKDEKLLILTDKCFEFAASKIPELDQDIIRRIRTRYKEKIRDLQDYSDPVLPECDNNALAINDQRQQTIRDYESYEQSLQNESEKWEYFRDKSKHMESETKSLFDHTDCAFSQALGEQSTRTLIHNDIAATKQNLLVNLEAAESTTKQIASTYILFENIAATETARLRDAFVSDESETGDETDFRRILDPRDDGDGSQ